MATAESERMRERMLRKVVSFARDGDQIRIRRRVSRPTAVCGRLRERVERRRVGKNLDARLVTRPRAKPQSSPESTETVQLECLHQVDERISAKVAHGVVLRRRRHFAQLEESWFHRALRTNSRE